MRIEYRTYPHSAKPGLNDRQFTKRHGQRVRIQRDGRWVWVSMAEVLRLKLGHLLSEQERMAAEMAQTMEDMLLDCSAILPTSFQGLSTRQTVTLWKPGPYLRKP